MEQENSTDVFRVDEWTIENFSFWNREIHGIVMTSPKYITNPNFTFDLFPKGLNGKEEHLVAVLRCTDTVTFSGELSFIGSDGSLLLTQQVDSSERRNDVTLPPGPRFEEVISEIRKNQDLHGDRLTVRSRIRRPRESNEYRRTTLDIFYFTFKISPKLFDDLGSGEKIVSWLPFGEEVNGLLNLSTAKGQIDSTKMILTLQPDPFKSNVLVHTRMSVLNNEDDVVRREEKEHLFRDGEIWTFVNSLSKEEVAGEGGCFILHFKIIPKNTNKRWVGAFHYHRDTVSLISTDKLHPPGPKVSKSHSSKKKSNLSDDSQQNLSKELLALYQDQELSDCQLKCGNVSFPVHKNILSARSPVFKTMLSTDMKEAVSGTVDIKDFDPSTLSLFLIYLYTGAVEGLQGESALKVYYAADKYQVPSLKRECSDFLCDNVSISNVCDILSLANKHQDDQLIAMVHDFIFKNFNEVLSSEEWKSFMRREPLLAVETLTDIAEKRYVSRRDAF